MVYFNGRLNRWSEKTGENSYVVYDVQHCDAIVTFEDGSRETVTDAALYACTTGYLDLSSDPLSSSTTSSPAKQCGSSIDVDNLAVGEDVSVVGTTESLHYFSNQVPGRKIDYLLHIPVVRFPNQFTSGAKIRVRVAGQETIRSFPNATNPESDYWDYIWNGKDAQGKTVVGPATAEVAYLDTVTVGSVVLENQPLVFFNHVIGTWKALPLGLGGWLLSSQRHFDAEAKLLYGPSGSATPAVGRQLYYNSTSDIITEGTTPNVVMVPSPDGSEAYIFSLSTGRHAQTRSTITGKRLKTFTYDSQSRLTGITDSFGNTIAITRPSSTQVQIRSPRGQVTTLTLNASGYATSIRSPGGLEHRATYLDANGLMATFTKPGGAVSTFTYDANGYLKSDSNSSGFRWLLSLTTSPTDSTRTIRMTTALNRVYQYQVTPTENTGVTRSEISPSGATQTFTSNPQQSEIHQKANGFYRSVFYTQDARLGVDALVPTQEYAQILASNTSDGLQITRQQTATTNATNALILDSESLTSTSDLGTSIRTYNASDKTYTFTSPMARVRTTTVNDFDQIVGVRVGNFSPITLGYDSSGRLLNVNQGTRSQSVTYDSLGRVATYTDALGRVHSFSYDLDGRVLNQTLPDGRVTAFSYDNNGNVTSLTPPSRPAHSFAFNLFDLPGRYTAPILGSLNTVTQYTYNNDKQLTRITRPDASLIELSYGSSSGRLASVKTPDGTHTRSYNTADQLTRIASPGSISVNWNYLGDNVLTQSTVAPGFTAGIEYTYQYFRPISVRLNGSNSSTVSLAYDSDNLLTRSGNMTITRGSTSGFVNSTTLGVVREQFSYNSTYGEVSSYQVLVNGTEVYRENYTRNSLGQITAKNEVSNGTTINHTYTYDSSARLTTATKSGVTTTYTYDANSNRLSVRRGTVTTNATYDAQDRLLTYGGNTYTHDLNGYRTLRTTTGSVESLALSYDALGALKQAVRITAGSTPGSSVSNTYVYLNDGMGRKVQRSRLGVAQVRYVYDEQSRVVGEINASTGAIKSHFVYGTRSHVPDYMIQGGVRYKFVHDHLGSVRMILNTSNGQVVSRMDYDEFGILQSGSLAPDFAPFGFAGGLRDAATGLVRFGARDYDPETGRWTAKDPILFSGGDANLYGYVLADPVNMIDPDGKSPLAAAYLAFEAGFFVGATINKLAFNIPYSRTYEGFSPVVNLMETIIPSSSFFLDSNTLKSVMNIFDRMEKALCE